MFLNRLVRGQAGQCAVGSEAIVIMLERLDLLHGIFEREEPVDVQTFVAEAAGNGVLFLGVSEAMKRVT